MNEPKLLPKREYFTKLVVEYCHQKIIAFRCLSDIGTNSSRVLDSSRACLDKTVVEAL